MASNIILVGFMGSGKTTAGRRLAERLGMTFLDMDDVIVQRTGKPISRIFAEDGEPHFRTLERALVRELAHRDNLVIGTGGGIVLNPDNVREFSRTGLVVCLTAQPDVILKRVGQDAARPLLECEDRLKRIIELKTARQPLYDRVTQQLDTSNLTVEEVVDRLIAMSADAAKQRS
jgi:shikimate kinase